MIFLLIVSTNYQKKPFEAVRFIKENPHVLAEIDKPGKIIDEIIDYRGLRVLEIGYHVLLEAKKMFTLLLGSDAMHAATCRMYEISDIATNDGDFKRVDFLDIWEPSSSEIY